MQDLKQKTLELIEVHKLQSWFSSVPSARAYAWDIIQYLGKNCPKDVKILEMGCGIGQNLVELWNLGFKNLYGVERDFPTYTACQELLDYFKVEANVGCWDAQENLPPTWKDFDIVAPLNFTYRKEIDMKSFLAHSRSMLKPGGLLIIDVISSSLHKNKAPEYSHRFSEKEFLALAEGYELLQVWHDYFPRSVYWMVAI